VGATIRFADWIGLFAEEPHRFIAAVPSEAADLVEGLAAQAGVPVSKLGEFGGDSISFENDRVDSFSVPLAMATETWRNAIPRRIS
jgi:phosphoribosylformylglycinamidine synthase